MKKVTKPMIEKLVRFTNVRKLLVEHLTTSGRVGLSQIPDLSDEEKAEIIDASIKAVDIEGQMLPIYQKHFSGEELLDIIAFFRSKAGQAYLAHQESVSREVVDTVPKIAVEMSIALATEVMKRRNNNE